MAKLNAELAKLTDQVAKAEAEAAEIAQSANTPASPSGDGYDRWNVSFVF